MIARPRRASQCENRSGKLKLYVYRNRGGVLFRYGRARPRFRTLIASRVPPKFRNIFAPHAASRFAGWEITRGMISNLLTRRPGHWLPVVILLTRQCENLSDATTETPAAASKRYHILYGKGLLPTHTRVRRLCALRRSAITFFRLPQRVKRIRNSRKLKVQMSF